MSTSQAGTVYAETLAAFEALAGPGEPLTAPEVASELDCDRRAVYDRLQALVERRELRTKKVGSRARVWWQPTGERQRRYETAFDGADASLWLLDGEGRVLDANGTARSRLGVDRSDVAGTPLPETGWWPSRDAGTGPIREAIRHASEGQRVRRQVTVADAGETVPVELVVGPLPGDLLLAEVRPLVATDADDRTGTANVAVELEFRSDQLAATLLEHATDTVEMHSDRAVSMPDGTTRRYWTVTGVAPETFRAAIEALPTIDDSRLLRTVGDTCRFELTIVDPSIQGAFDSFDGEFNSASLRDDQFCFRGRFPRTVDAEGVLDTVRGIFPDVEFVSQRRVLTSAYLQQLVEDRLTDRQHTVLKLAYSAGYYEQPRGSTGAELADELGVSKQTFHHHLRNAEATVCEQVFKDASTEF